MAILSIILVAVKIIIMLVKGTGERDQKKNPAKKKDQPSPNNTRLKAEQLKKELEAEKVRNAKLEQKQKEDKKMIEDLNKQVLNDGKNKANSAAVENAISTRPESLVALNEMCEEFASISERFKRGCGQFKDSIRILEILQNKNNDDQEMHLKIKERVQKEMNTQDEQQVIKSLWHGSTEGKIYSICVNGFNRSFAGAIASRYGDGIYFAVHPDYCIVNHFSHPNHAGVHHIILAEVVTGKSCQGEPGQKQLPPGFHSGVDNTGLPNMYIVYKDWAAYPEYVISFKLM